MDFEVYILWVVIAAIAGIAHLVRKGLEKLKGEGEGKRIDLATAVHKRIRKYMAPLENTGRSPENQAIEPVEAAETADEAPRLVSRQRPVEAPPSPPGGRPRDRSASSTGESKRRRPRSISRKSLSEVQPSGAPPPPPSRPLLTLDPADLRKALLMAEILGPPMAEREDYRLF